MVFWHRDLPPIDAVVIGEHTVEANSSRVGGTLAHRSEIWDRCHQELMANAEIRVIAEIARLGGSYAHVHGESIGAKHDDVVGEAWLHGTFTYVLYGAGNAASPSRGSSHLPMPFRVFSPGLSSMGLAGAAGHAQEQDVARRNGSPECFSRGGAEADSHARGIGVAFQDANQIHGGSLCGGGGGGLQPRLGGPAETGRDGEDHPDLGRGVQIPHLRVL